MTLETARDCVAKENVAYTISSLPKFSTFAVKFNQMGELDERLPGNEIRMTKRASEPVPITAVSVVLMPLAPISREKNDVL